MSIYVGELWFYGLIEDTRWTNADWMAGYAIFLAIYSWNGYRYSDRYCLIRIVADTTECTVHTHTQMKADDDVNTDNGTSIAVYRYPCMQIAHRQAVTPVCRCVVCPLHVRVFVHIAIANNQRGGEKTSTHCMANLHVGATETSNLRFSNTMYVMLRVCLHVDPTMRSS